MSADQRLVVADQLSGSDDPLGEFLVLQHKPVLLAAERRRSAELLRTYARRWLGPLSRAVKQDGLRFENGVVVACMLSGERAAELTNQPAWKTVRALDLSACQYGVTLERFALFLRAPSMSGLRELKNVSLDITRLICRMKLPFTLKHLEIPWLTRPEEVVRSPLFDSLETFRANGRAWKRVGSDWVA